jgi:raffinose/stachyose/melibiose transport system permease protein
MEKSLARYFPLFVLPTLASFTRGFIGPFVLGIWLSFCEFKTIQDATFVGFRNYIHAFTNDDTFLYSLGFSTLFTITSLVLINVAAFGLAMLLTQKLKGTNIFRTIFFLPNLIGGIVLGYIWLLIFNGVLASFGTALDVKAHFGFWGLIILCCWQQIGYMMIIYIAGLQTIPEEVNEASGIDGATGSQRLFQVTIPMMMPSITICTFLTVSNGFKLFDQNLALTDGAPGRATEMLALNIFKTFYSRPGFEGVGQAKAVMFFILVVAIGLLQLRVTRSKEVQV